MWLWRRGFVDSLTEGGNCFWRWDFWNSIEMGSVRRRTAERAQDERENAVELWGPGA